MATSSGINKVTAYAKETTAGTAANVANGVVARRVSSNFNLQKETYQSDEIRVDYQMADYRHSTRTVDGSLSSELFAGAWEDFFAAALSRDFTAGATTGAASATFAVDAGAGTITRSAGDFLTDGFKVGEIVRATGFAQAGNNDNNLLILSVTSTVLTVVVLGDTPLVTEAEGELVTVAATGQKTYAPQTGHTDDSFTFEEYYSDIDESEVFVGNKVNSAAVSLPATGMATVDFGFMGIDFDETNSGSGQYFTAPVEAGCGGSFAAVNGALIVNGVAVALVTSVDFTINRNLSTQAVVGSNVTPEVYEGRILVDGSFSTLFEDGTFRDYFVNETEVALAVALTASNEKDADAISFVFPRIKINSADKDDGENQITSTHSFQALLKCDNAGAGTDSEKTTMVVQDTSLV